MVTSRVGGKHKEENSIQDPWNLIGRKLSLLPTSETRWHLQTLKFPRVLEAAALSWVCNRSHLPGTHPACHEQSGQSSWNRLGLQPPLSATTEDPGSGTPPLQAVLPLDLEEKEQIYKPNTRNVKHVAIHSSQTPEVTGSTYWFPETP